VESGVLDRLLDQYLLSAAPDPILSRIIAAHGDRSLGAQELAQVVQESPELTRAFLEQKSLARRIAEWSEEQPGRADLQDFLVKRVAGLLGKTAVRDQVARLLLPQPGIGKPAEITYARKAEAEVESRSWAFAEIAFQAGLHYDWLASQLSIRRAPRDAVRVLDESFLEGLATARFAHAISLRLRSLELGRFAFAAAALLPLGRALMATVFPWSRLRDEAGRSGAPWSAAYLDLLEGRRFETSTPELSGLFIVSFGLLREVEPAVRFGLEPWLLEGLNPAQKELAWVLSLSSRLARGGLPAREQRRWMELRGLDSTKISGA
jgi:hypothetical protein